MRHRNFAIFWTGALVSNIGTWIQNVTVPYVLFKTTDSAAWVGVAGFCQFIPGVILGPWSGAIADRFDRRRVLMVTQFALACCAFGLWVMWQAGVRSPGALVGVVLLTGIIGALNVPTWQAFVTELVPKEDLLNAVTLNSAQFNAARAIGPALGGLILATLGPSWAFLLNAISYAAVILAVWLVRVTVRHIVPTGQHVLADFVDACRYVRNHAAILMCIALVFAVAFLANPMLQLRRGVRRAGVPRGRRRPRLAHRGVRHRGDRRDAVRLRVERATRPGPPRRGLAHLARRRASSAFGLSTELWVGMLAMFSTGMAYLALIATLNTTVQLAVEERLRGRVLAVYFMTFTAGYPLGSLLQGWLAEQVGLHATVAGAGVILLAISRCARVAPRVPARHGWACAEGSAARTRYDVTSAPTRWLRADRAILLAEQPGEPVARGEPALRDDVEPERERHRDAEPDAEERVQRAAGDEALDHACDREDDDQPEDDHDRSPSLLGERITAGVVARIDDRPAEPEARRTRDDDGAELEQAVGEDQPPELRRLARGREEPGGDADVRSVQDQDVGRHAAEQDAGRERVDRDLHVVDEDLGRELGGGLGGVVRLEVLVDVGLAHGLRCARFDRRLRVGEPHTDCERGHERERGGDDDEPAVVPHRAGEADREEPRQSARPCGAGCRR